MTPRGAARSHDLLLAAATELFAERGYDRTTVRELGERAGVDPALIARHFGSKAGLYLAALAGAWTALVAGFGGMREDGRSLAPR